jgi:TolB-like protein/tetratricopeptide (TPR) repeat protein
MDEDADPANRLALRPDLRLRRMYATARQFVRRRWARILAVATLAAAVLGIVGHTLGGIAGISEFHRVSSTSTAKAGSESRSAPSARPFRSLVIMPLKSTDQSSDGKELAQRIGREVTIAASRTFFDGLVISHGLASTYADRAFDPRRIGEELGVRYVVESHLGTAADGQELSMIVTDALDASQVATVRHVFPAGDTGEASARVANELRLALFNVTRREVATLPRAQRDAWDVLLRGEALDDSIVVQPEKQRLFEQALRLDPGFVLAMLDLARVLHIRAQNEPANRPDMIHRLDDVSRRATGLAPRDPRAWQWRAFSLLWQKNWHGAVSAVEQVLRLDPFRPGAHSTQAAVLIMTGRSEEALKPLDRAAELGGDAATTDQWRCVALAQLARDSDALPSCERTAAAWDYWIIYAYATGVAANAGQSDRATVWKKKLVGANPGISIASLRDCDFAQHPVFAEKSERLFQGLRSAGIPER